ncbi:MAG: SIR2 family protein [Bacteroidetes bacterium]|nr:SIR2 family protein [Bacteroidota bacterium]
MTTIPHHLIEQIKSGNVVLFLGAGASYNAIHRDNKKIPNGKELKTMLSEKFLGRDMEGSLDYIAELCISESSLFEVQQFIASIFKEFHPNQYHLKIPNFNWKNIFTTNYDLIIEESYGKIESPVRELVPVFKNTPQNQIYYKADVLPYYKIHGSISDINDPDAPLILTPDQFATHQNKRDRLYVALQELAYDYPFLFVGFGMADPDIRYVLNKLDKDNVSRVRSFMVGPHINDLEEKLWESKKITPIKMSFEDFLNELDKKIDATSRKLAVLRTETIFPIYSHFVVSVNDVKPTSNFLSFIQDTIEYVHANISAPNSDPKEFYRGFFNNWDPIIKNLDAPRSIKDGILFEVFLSDEVQNSTQTQLYLLKGNGGSGKSVLLKRLAFDAATELDKFCIFLKPGAYVQPQQIIELYNYVKQRIYLFVDNVAGVSDDLIYLIKKVKKDQIPLTIICAERFNVWNTECQELAVHLTQSYQIKYLNDFEIKGLLSLLERHNSLYALKNKSIEQRIKEFSEKAGRELLVALYEATNGKPFTEIILNEYHSINDPKAQSLYLTVSIFHKIGAEARAGFISRVHNISFHEFKEKLFQPLEYIVFDRKDSKINDYVYLTRNRSIAEIIFETVLTSPQDRYDEYIRILNNLNIDYNSDHMAFMAIVNARKLIDTFPDPQMIRKIYEAAMKLSKDDPKLWQQQAIFEMTSPGGNLPAAEQHLKLALKDNADPFISHTLSELYLRKAEKSKFDREFFEYIDQAISICNSIIKKNYSNPHPYHTILKAYILKLRKVLSQEDAPAMERCLKDIEKVIASTKQYFHEDQFLLEIESSFNELINDSQNAQELLERAFNANKSSPYIASRLANFYEKKGMYSEATQVTKDALSHNPIDKDLNFKYAMLLEKENKDYDDIKYYLKRSFTKGDSRFQAQFSYARVLYITNEIPKAADIFKELAVVNAAPEIKNKAQGIVKVNGQNIIFNGTVTTVEMSYGFIKREMHGDDIFFYRFDNDGIDWDLIRRGTKVSFKMGFNYKGPVAIGVKFV